MDAPPPATWRPDWRDHATSLLVAYNDGLLANPARLSAANAGHARVVLSGSTKALEALYAVFVWARRQGIDPTAWVRWNARRVKTAETQEERLLNLFTLERVALYRADPMTSVNEATARDRELHARLGASGFVVGRDLHDGAELAKRGFRERGREILCIEAKDLTHGFHAQSVVCSSCPLRDRCAAETREWIERSR